MVLKRGWTEQGAHYGWIDLAIVCTAASGALLLIARRIIPMGTAYAVWTGIGAVGTFVLGIMVFFAAENFARFFRRSGQGEGGKYLLLLPGCAGEEPEGYFTFRSPT